MNEILILILIGLGAGMLSGLVGVGGGVIIVPGLMFFMGLTQQQAQGTSLAMMLAPVGILAVLHYYQKGQVNLYMAAILCLGFVAGAWGGARIALWLSQEALKKVFAVVMILIALKILFNK